MRTFRFYYNNEKILKMIGGLEVAGVSIIRWKYYYPNSPTKDLSIFYLAKILHDDGYIYDWGLK